jgi:hypothetical protein
MKQIQEEETGKKSVKGFMGGRSRGIFICRLFNTPSVASSA